MIQAVRLHGDPLLRERSHEVKKFDRALFILAGDLQDTMRANNGVGLAANQIGKLQRVFTWEIEGSHGVAVNPRITRQSTEVQTGDEGCLSLPGLFYPVTRPLEVRMAYQVLDGAPRFLDARGLLARVVLHELDHLNGILFLDHLKKHDRRAAIKRIHAGELTSQAGAS